ncbi:universal stress protein [Egicoccus sp. AB-alg2]|uniref:universal stress protein n=1 Tax=Egicoccus sp. AB-alg2 TaxID=3242693 RepID=UPI00359D872A
MDRIVVGVDGSDQSRTALRWAVDEARVHGAALEVVHAYDDTPAYEVYRYPAGLPSVEEVEARHERMAAYATDLVEGMVAELGTDLGIEVTAEAVQGRRPAQVLLERAKGADLLVVGTRGRGGFAGLLLGSVSQQCIHHAPCPLAVVPTHEH